MAQCALRVRKDQAYDIGDAQQICLVARRPGAKFIATSEASRWRRRWFALPGGDREGFVASRLVLLSYIEVQAEGVGAAEFERRRLAAVGATGELSQLPVVNGQIDFKVGVGR